MMLDRVKFWYILAKEEDMFKKYVNHDDPKEGYTRFLNDVSRKYHMVLSPIMTNFAMIFISGKDPDDTFDPDSDSELIEMYDWYRDGKFKNESHMKHPKVEGVSPNVLGKANSRCQIAGGAGRGKGGKGLGKGAGRILNGSWDSPPANL